MPRIYLDNAATSWPKPEAVYDAVDRYQREVGSAAGRGNYDSAKHASEILRQARSGITRLLGTDEPQRIVLTTSGTASLNLAIHGLLRPGDHVVTTVCEHNSVLRPLAWQREHAGVSVDFAGCDTEGLVSADEVVSLLRPETKLVVLTHASNVTGAIQPIAEVGAACMQRETLLLVDGAQTLGHIPLDLHAAGVDLFAAPGHKGLLGPLGTGLLYVGARAEELINPPLQGGTGLVSDLESPPTELPHSLEPGNLNMPGIAGLAVAAQLLDEETLTGLIEHEQQNITQLLEGLHAVQRVEVHGPNRASHRMPVVSFAIEGYDPHEVATLLAEQAGIECRAGLHCAPRMHQQLGTSSAGGSVRLSPGPNTSEVEIQTALELIRQLAEANLE